jgi:hypothetical protein
MVIIAAEPDAEHLMSLNCHVGLSRGLLRAAHRGPARLGMRLSYPDFALAPEACVRGQ